LFDKSDYHERYAEHTDSYPGHRQLSKKYIRPRAHLAMENDNANHQRIAEEAKHERQKQDGELQEGDAVDSPTVFIICAGGIHFVHF